VELVLPDEASPVEPADSADPVEPLLPSEPVDSDAPAEPVEPLLPEESDDSDEPADPVEPLLPAELLDEEPDDPDEPAEPVEPLLPAEPDEEPDEELEDEEDEDELLGWVSWESPHATRPAAANRATNNCINRIPLFTIISRPGMAFIPTIIAATGRRAYRFEARYPMKFNGADGFRLTLMCVASRAP
jgi:hypothetical protein